MLASGVDETRVRADAERRLLQPQDDAEVGRAKDLPSFRRGNGGPPHRGPALRGYEESPSAAAVISSDGGQVCWVLDWARTRARVR
jgi:hypothetical protein